jgi:hypothetical protein
MMWYLGITVIVILVALPVIVRLRTGVWGNGKGFRETWSAIRNAPGVKEQRKNNFKAIALLLFGLPLGLSLVSLCEWLQYPRATYVPIATGVMLLSSNLLASYLYNRKAQSTSDKT